MVCRKNQEKEKRLWKMIFNFFFFLCLVTMKKGKGKNSKEKRRENDKDSLPNFDWKVLRKVCS